jgi:staphylococcal nuclease domain-containing protein 1
MVLYFSDIFCIFYAVVNCIVRCVCRLAKENKKRIWKDYKPSSSIDIKDKSFTAKVTEVINGDALMVKLADGTAKKIFLSSIRSPKLVSLVN